MPQACAKIAYSILSAKRDALRDAVCVCVCVRERERERWSWYAPYLEKQRGRSEREAGAEAGRVTELIEPHIYLTQL